ncbi:tyrosine-protein kinase-like otk [Caerostris extrusa]|uniref:Tyrosine-protein kinase-like otk n=1 Tax=Caerostris extrusa TaxID=172846 RepID=A0AAV4SA80_CAEEX|nr:tyrosine-protein kinase-like otk [Caerostris extrusa]
MRRYLLKCHFLFATQLLVEQLGGGGRDFTFPPPFILSIVRTTAERPNPVSSDSLNTTCPFNNKAANLLRCGGNIFRLPYVRVFASASVVPLGVSGFPYINGIGDQARVVLQSPDSASQLTEKGEMVLRCKVEGSSEVRFEWFHNGLRMFRNERVSFRNKRLQVASLTPADNGIYSCRAVSEVGVVDSTDNFALMLPSDTAARIQVLPKDTIAIKNGSAMFDCVFENAAAVEWYTQTNDVPLSNNSRFIIFPNGSLSISGILNSDEGIYKCVGISDISKEAPQQTYATRLKLAYIEGFSDSPFEPPISPDELKVVALGSQFEVTCVKPNGRPKVKIWWEDPSGHVISDTGRIRVDDSQLIVDGAKKTDTGNYTCNAENIAGQERTSLYFYVASAPTITLPPAGLVTEEGDTAMFTCEFNGSPYPVTQKVVMSDAGDYVCEVVTNGFQPVRSEKAKLVVKEQLKFVPPPVSTRLELGSVTKVYCKARGSSAPVVRWKKWGNHFLIGLHIFKMIMEHLLSKVLLMMMLENTSVLPQALKELLMLQLILML